MQPNTVKDHLYYSTVMIESAQSSGTAFLLSKSFGHLARVYLVSNKHVVKDKTECQIRFHQSESLSPENKVGDFIHQFTNEEWTNGWKFHVDNQVDLAVFNLTETMSALHEQQKHIFYRCLSTDHIVPKEETKFVPAMQKVFFVGYPSAMRDEVNNLPIARSGYLATPLYTDFDGKEAFLLDASVFEGSSGSPICIVNEENTGCSLVGVNSETYNRKSDKEYLDIGYAWKAYKILEILEQNGI
ncbi:TPA: trypsin-like peptidase domain-containing protein [Acinetobacter baumannii]|uniref:trypsin-like peptidase domain-containing protein n=1 Tax=Acinetobacter baumannii TaxID=470 RepID=UPI00338FB215